MSNERGDGDGPGFDAAVVEASPNPILVVDSETVRVLAANDAAADSLDRSRDALLDSDPEQLLSAAAFVALERAIETGSARETVPRIRREPTGGDTDSGARTGGRRAEITAERTGDGRVLVFLGRATGGQDGAVPAFDLEGDLTVLEQLVAASDDSYWLFDAGFDEALFVDGSYEEIWGLSAADLRADPTDFLTGVHPDDRERTRAAMKRLAEGSSERIELRVNPGEDFERWVSVRGEPIREDGTVTRVAGFTRDITDRVDRERRLEHSRRQFEAIFNDPQLLVGLLDPDGTVRRINETAIGLADIDRETAEGTHFAETPWWNHDPELQADLREWLAAARDGEYVEYDAEHRLSDGSEMAVEGVIRPVTDDDGTVIALLASARDVTERVERERALAASNERLEQFAYVTSHDLQEPLRTVSNYTELLAEEYDEDLDAEAREFLEVVVTGSRRMQSMLNGLLDYSRVTTRGDELRPVDAEDILADVADSLGAMLEESTLEWGALPTVVADGDQLGQVFQNLVTNAVEHADGPVTVEVRADDEGDRYRFAVADDGPGIAENRQDKIFRIFKSGTTYQTTSQAKGIGLAICDNIVRRHDGEIWVESEPGEGATFMFTIPKRSMDEKSSGATP